MEVKAITDKEAAYGRHFWSFVWFRQCSCPVFRQDCGVVWVFVLTVVIEWPCLMLFCEIVFILQNMVQTSSQQHQGQYLDVGAACSSSVLNK